MFARVAEALAVIALYAIVTTFAFVYLAIAIVLAVAHEMRQLRRRLWRKG